MATRPRTGISGADAVRKNLKAIQNAVFDAIENELEEQGKIVLNKANEVAPQDTGEMIATSIVTKDSNRAALQIVVAIAYVVTYAILQHERVYNPGPITATKIGKRRGAGRKWFEKKFTELRPEIIKQVGRAVERALISVLR